MKWLKYIGIFMLFIAAGFYGMIWMAPTEVSFRVNEDINAPRAVVLDALSNPEKLPNWINGLELAKQKKGRGAEVGAEYNLFFAGQGEMVMSQKISAIDSAFYAYIGTVPDFMQVVSKTSLESLDSNKTRLSSEVTIKALSNKMKMFMYAEETHRDNAAKNFTKLKEFLEK